MAPGTDLLLSVASLALAAAIVAWALRALRCPGGPLGAAALAGAIIGLGAGSLVLGSAAPRLADMLTGGGTQRLAIEEADRLHAEEVASLQRIGVTGEAIDELRAEHAAALSELRQARADARAERRELLCRAAGVAFLLTALFLRFGARREEETDPARADRAGSIALASILGPLVAGSGAALLAGRALMLDWRTALCVGAVAGLSTPFFAAARAWRPPGMRAAGAGAMGFFLPLATAGLVAGRPEASMLAAAVAILALAPSPLGSVDLRARPAPAIALGLLAPLVGALSFALIDPTPSATTRAGVVTLLIAFVLTFDARWLGAWAAYHIAGDAPLRSLAWRSSADHLGPGAGLAQIAAACAFADALGPALFAPALLSALALEITSGLRSRMARALDGPAQH